MCNSSEISSKTLCDLPCDVSSFGYDDIKILCSMDASGTEGNSMDMQGSGCAISDYLGKLRKGEDY